MNDSLMELKKKLARTKYTRLEEKSNGYEVIFVIDNRNIETPFEYKVKIKKSQVAQALEIVEATKEERNEIQKKLNQLMNHKRKMVKELLQLQKEQDALKDYITASGTQHTGILLTAQQDLTGIGKSMQALENHITQTWELQPSATYKYQDEPEVGKKRQEIYSFFVEEKRK
ncbi:MAG: hypothetical protein RBR72_02560 [Prevotella sp.]|jgi:small-conductance mechanosensitive channel|nr:hypothetical protein [Prevotella sp.]